MVPLKVNVMKKKLNGKDWRQTAPEQEKFWSYQNKMQCVTFIKPSLGNKTVIKHTRH